MMQEQWGVFQFMFRKTNRISISQHFETLAGLHNASWATPWMHRQKCISTPPSKVFMHYLIDIFFFLFWITVLQEEDLNMHVYIPLHSLPAHDFLQLFCHHSTKMNFSCFKCVHSNNKMGKSITSVPCSSFSPSLVLSFTTIPTVPLYFFANKLFYYITSRTCTHKSIAVYCHVTHSWSISSQPTILNFCEIYTSNVKLKRVRKNHFLFLWLKRCFMWDVYIVAW